MRIELEFSDEYMGCDELGWMPRLTRWPYDAYASEDEDAAYRRFVKKNKGIDVQVVEGYLLTKEDITR
jgi:hypothetical protein